MTGMELAETYFQEYGTELIKPFEKYKPYMAAGLVGDGSECFGFDDEISRDHDFGPGFVIWMPEEICRQIGGPMQTAYDRLPKSFQGFERRETPQGAGRTGIMSIESFCLKYIGIDDVPQDNLDWFKIPESYLATATNGRVFMDELGRFTEIRKTLLAFYPEDVIKKKLAARITAMAQAGQYNYGRCLQRGDEGAAFLALAEFVNAALGALYLLNKRYMPFYKWAFRGAENFDVLPECPGKLRALAKAGATPQWQLESQEKQGANAQQIQTIEDICAAVAGELRSRGWASSKNNFLTVHGEELMKGIADPILSKLPVTMDITK